MQESQTLLDAEADTGKFPLPDPIFPRFPPPLRGAQAGFFRLGCHDTPFENH